MTKIIRIAFSSAVFFVISSAAFAQTVTIKQGDTLSSIAERELGADTMWLELCEINRAALQNCDFLPVGLELRLPETASAGQTQEAPPSLIAENQAVSIIANSGIEDWDSQPDGAVKKTWQNGRLVLTRGSGGGIDGAAQQALLLEQGQTYELRATITEADVAFRIEGTDKEYIRLPVGEQLIIAKSSGSGGVLEFWPYAENSSSVISDLSLKPVD